jgi:SAM-dependent methyltransferase
MIPELSIRNPKRYKYSKNGRADWYEYYAAYSGDFVSDAINCAHIPQGSIILDPWNGSGTTTQIANEMGYNAYGYDINPVMFIIAKARQLDPGVKNSLNAINNDILVKAKRKTGFEYINNDPLQAWFDKATVSAVRNIDHAIRKLLVDEKANFGKTAVDNYNNISDLAAFFYLVLFRTVRKLIVPFLASNPTWVKVAKDQSELQKWEPGDIHKIYRSIFNEMLNEFDLYPPQYTLKRKNQINLGIANSEDLPISTSTIDSIISSPPYCTRIDYAISTRPELAILGFSEQDLDALRRKMIGTPKISPELPDIDLNWGSTCLEFINNVARHDSKAAKSYYYKHFLQYFNGISKSILELDRVLKKDGICILVLQDSYFKDVYNDLPRIFTEMVQNIQWKIKHRVDFKARQSMANINRKTKQYRSRISTTETVLVFQK